MQNPLGKNAEPARADEGGPLQGISRARQVEFFFLAIETPTGAPPQADGTIHIGKLRASAPITITGTRQPARDSYSLNSGVASKSF
ncbi:MAG: hypothetical protein Q7T80_10990 [Methanoregula sp.]|nr:hypothetical protein [Methanoregula sp.]